MVRRGIALTFAVILALLLILPAEAHATLVRSDPPAGALLTTAPKALVLEFSERVDPSFSAVRLLDSNSQVVNAGPGVIDPAAPRVLRLPLAELPKDSYTAVWKVRSADDGHVTEGSVPFGVGVAVTTTALIPPLGAPDPATPPPPLLDSATRWLNLLTGAVALGGLPFALLVWRPAWRAAQRAGADCEATDEAMMHTLRRLLIGGGALFLLTNLLFLVAQAAMAAGRSRDSLALVGRAAPRRRVAVDYQPEIAWCGSAGGHGARRGDRLAAHFSDGRLAGRTGPTVHRAPRGPAQPRWRPAAGGAHQARVVQRAAPVGRPESVYPLAAAAHVR
jgi:methionine-rich copper-binding protein CopC